MNACHVVCAGDNTPACLPRKEQGDFVIAADAGLLFLRQNGLEPDLFVGDGDSLGYVPEDLPARVLPVAKDDTDTQAALKTGLNKGYTLFYLYGALGGRRLSHALANIRNLSFLADHGAKGVILSENCRVELLLTGVTRFSQTGGYFSLLAARENTCVSVRGAKFQGEKIPLSYADSLGVSNEPAAESTEIEVFSGRALLIREF